MRYKKALAGVFALVFVTSNFISMPAQADYSYLEGKDAARVLFDPTKVSQINLKMSDENFNLLKSPYVSWNSEGDWLPTTMNAVVDGVKYGPYKVGVHLKGAWGSWRDVTGKAGFKIKMDAFVARQAFFGLTKLTLNNMVQDSSYIHETLYYKLMRQMGMPAPRTGYTNVVLNGIDYGLHLNAETISKEMLARWSITSSHLYRAGIPNFPDFVIGNEGLYFIEVGSPNNTSDLTAFMEINDLSGDDWWKAMNRTADMNQILRQWAVEIYASHWDGYLLNLNNYYINFDKRGIATMYSWGTDQTWGGYADYFSFRGLLPNKCLGSTACSNAYRDALAELARVSSQLDFATFSQAVITGITPAIDSDPWRGIDQNSISWYQAAAVQTAIDRAAELQRIVTPWDTNINRIIVNNINYLGSDKIYLPPRTKNVTIQPMPSQLDAKSTPITTTLKPGDNLLTTTVISADNQHQTVRRFNAYVLTDRSTNFEVKFNGDQLDKDSQFRVTVASHRLVETKSIKIEVAFPTSYPASSKANQTKLLENTFTKLGLKIESFRTTTLKSLKGKASINIRYRD